MHPLAEELNCLLDRDCPVAGRLLSQRGRGLFFPRGIISQSQEAAQKATQANATIGIATDGKTPLYLDCIHKYFNGLAPADVYPYAPSTGKKPLREAWLEKIRAENPSLGGKPVSLPVVTNGLTQGLSTLGDLFLDPGDVILLPDKFWGNYRLIFSVRLGAGISTYPLYAPEGGFNVAGLEKALAARPKDSKTMVLLNFPNNPTGFSPSLDHARRIVEVLVAASRDRDLLVVMDDAYFGLFYEPGLLEESLFGALCGASERILAVKADAATKEEFVWGFRCGFLTFGAGNGNADIYAALEKKVGGAIRGSLSNVSHLGQTLVLKALQDPDFSAQQQAARDILADRAKQVTALVHQDAFKDCWDVHPFNAGYFMCLALKGITAEEARTQLLDKHGIGTIAAGEKDLRIAFSSLPAEKIEPVFRAIADVVRAAR